MNSDRDFLLTHVDPGGDVSKRIPVGRQLGGGRLGSFGGELEWRHRDAAQRCVGASGVGRCVLIQIPGRANTWRRPIARGDVLVGRQGERLERWVRVSVVAVVGYWDFGGTLELVGILLAEEAAGYSRPAKRNPTDCVQGT